MDDTISRQAAIEEIARRDTTDGTVKVFSGREINEIIKGLPSAQPEKMLIANINLTDEQVKEAFEKAKLAKVEILYAQPEIIRCKDCKYKVETEEGEYNPEDIVCSYWSSDGLMEKDFCSFGEREDE